MASRKERIALNEAAFRTANERMNAWSERADARTEPHGFLCECADDDCRTWLKLTAREYEAVRADPMRFLIVPGHERPDAERVIERHDHYAVIEKYEEARRIVEGRDPRR
jgi:hypothetical protein